MSAAQTSEAPGGRTRFLGRELSPLTQRRLRNFRANKRGYWSLWIFLTLFIVALFAEFVANDRPFLVSYQGEFYLPAFELTLEGGLFCARKA